MSIKPSREQILLALKEEIDSGRHADDEFLKLLLSHAYSEIVSIRQPHSEVFGYGRRTVFGTFLGMLRQNKGLRLIDTARAAGISSATASRFEHEAGLPDHKTLQKLADYLCPSPPVQPGGEA